MSWARGERGEAGRQTHSVWQGWVSKRDGQVTALLGLDVGDPRHFHRGTHSQPPRLQGADSCSSLHAMAQTLYLLVLIVAICSGEILRAAPGLLSKVLAGVIWKKTPS